jgi:HD-GYP domain-containing protein (c-di-GMP phosphodiesterase class II)
LEIQLAPGHEIEFSEFPVDSLVDNSVTDFDLFIQLQDHFILYSGNGYKWDRSELTELLSCGHQNFFIRKCDSHKAKMYHNLIQLPIVEKELAPFERLQTIEQVGAKFIQCLYEGDITEACIGKAKGLGDTIVETLIEDSSAIAALSGLADHDYYTYYHSIRVASYAVSIAIGMGCRDQSILQSIALGGIFHDIGKKEIPLTVLNKAGPLTEAEWEMMRSHPETGHSQILETILDHVPREIIVHHHEKINGSGYPHGLEGGSLLTEVQIATVADIFDALTSSRSYQARRSRYEALDFIKHRLLGEEIQPDTFKALVMALAPRKNVA